MAGANDGARAGREDEEEDARCAAWSCCRTMAACCAAWACAWIWAARLRGAGPDWAAPGKGEGEGEGWCCWAGGKAGAGRPAAPLLMLPGPLGGRAGAGEAAPLPCAEAGPELEPGAGVALLLPSLLFLPLAAPAPPAAPPGPPFPLSPFFPSPFFPLPLPFPPAPAPPAAALCTPPAAAVASWARVAPGSTSGALPLAAPPLLLPLAPPPLPFWAPLSAAEAALRAAFDAAFCARRWSRSGVDLGFGAVLEIDRRRRRRESVRGARGGGGRGRGSTDRVRVRARAPVRRRALPGTRGSRRLHEVDAERKGQHAVAARGRGRGRERESARRTVVDGALARVGLGRRGGRALVRRKLDDGLADVACVRASVAESASSQQWRRREEGEDGPCLSRKDQPS